MPKVQDKLGRAWDSVTGSLSSLNQWGEDNINAKADDQLRDIQTKRSLRELTEAPAPREMGELEKDLQKGTQRAMGMDNTQYVTSPQQMEQTEQALRTTPPQLVEEVEDPEMDSSLFEPTLFSDAAYDYWNTAEPAEPEERSLFESPSFQQSALTFGLTLMMGGSFQDAMYNGGEAFSRSEYKNTDEYNEMLNMGIPGYIIEDAYISGDSQQLNSFYKTRQDIIAKAEEAEAARLNPAMSEEVRSMYKNFGDQAHELTTRNTALAKILGSYDPKSVINPIQQIELLYSLAKANDPDSAVKEAEIALNRLGQSWPADVKLQFSRVFTGEATADTLDPEYARLLADHLHNKYKSEWTSNMNQFETLNKQSDYLKIARDKQFWRTQQQQFAKNQFSSTGINLTGE